MSEDEADCMRAPTNVDRTGAKTIGHAREARGLDDKAMGLIREESIATVEALAAEG